MIKSKIKNTVKKMAGLENTKVILLNEDGRNFQAWCFQISVILKAEGLFNVVSGVDKAEEKEDFRVQKLLVTSVGEKVL